MVKTRSDMMNTSHKGAHLERAIAKALVLRGWSVVRGAGSKSYGPGKIDLVAINPEKKVVLILQAKNYARGGLHAAEKERTDLWRIFNPNFEKVTYTVKCESIVTVGDVELVDMNL